jgi:hypothetical protein
MMQHNKYAPMRQPMPGQPLGMQSMGVPQQVQGMQGLNQTPAQMQIDREKVLQVNQSEYFPFSSASY